MDLKTLRRDAKHYRWNRLPNGGVPHDRVYLGIGKAGTEPQRVVVFQAPADDREGKLPLDEQGWFVADATGISVGDARKGRPRTHWALWYYTRGARP